MPCSSLFICRMTGKEASSSPKSVNFIGEKIAIKKFNAHTFVHFSLLVTFNSRTDTVLTSTYKNLYICFLHVSIHRVWWHYANRNLLHVWLKPTKDYYLFIEFIHIEIFCKKNNILLGFSLLVFYIRSLSENCWLPRAQRWIKSTESLRESFEFHAHTTFSSHHTLADEWRWKWLHIFAFLSSGYSTKVVILLSFLFTFNLVWAERIRFIYLFKFNHVRPEEGFGSCLMPDTVRTRVS